MRLSAALDRMSQATIVARLSRRILVAKIQTCGLASGTQPASNEPSVRAWRAATIRVRLGAWPWSLAPSPCVPWHCSRPGHRLGWPPGDRSRHRTTRPSSTPSVARTGNGVLNILWNQDARVLNSRVSANGNTVSGPHTVFVYNQLAGSPMLLAARRVAARVLHGDSTGAKHRMTRWWGPRRPPTASRGRCGRPRPPRQHSRGERCERHAWRHDLD